MWRVHQIGIDGIERFRVRDVATSPKVAMAFCRIVSTDIEHVDMFFIIRINRDGLITFIQWATQDAI
jgi:hypothetical protein